jgi:Kef-type K+ transport system membrane component KefB
MEQVTEKATAPLQELEHTLMPFVTFLIMPIFALANAGVVIAEDFGAVITNSIAVGIVAGLVIGKPLGIFVFCEIESGRITGRSDIHPNRRSGYASGRWLYYGAFHLDPRLGG